MKISKNVLSKFLLISVISLLGFITENVWLALTKGYIDNRNMFLPFLLGDGLATIGIFALFGTPQKPTFLGKKLEFANQFLSVLYYMFVVLICICIGEMILGNTVEKVCNIQWWNYTKLPLHIGQYTSIPTSFGFTCIITLFMYFCFTPLDNFFLKWNYNILLVVSVSLMIVMSIDFIHSGLYMLENQSVMRLWRFYFETKSFKFY